VLRKAIIGLGALALLTGCASAVKTDVDRPGGTSAPTRQPVRVATTCPSSVSNGGRADGQLGGPVPPGATISWVLNCRSTQQAISGKGVWQVLLSERSDGPAEDLLRALAQPDQPPSTGACPAIGAVLPYFVLVDSNGVGYLPRMPLTACGLPQEGAQQALHAMTWRLMSSVPVRQMETPLAAQTGCSSVYKDVFRLEAGSASPAGPAFPWPSPPPTVRICEYASQPDGYEANLLNGRVLNVAQTRAFLNELLGSAAGATCSPERTHTQFAVVSAEQSTGNEWYIELDGCRRVLRPNQTLGQASPSLRRLLAG